MGEASLLNVGKKKKVTLILIIEERQVLGGLVLWLRGG